MNTHETDKPTRQVQSDSLLGLALSEVDSFGIFNIFDQQSETSSIPVDLEAITLQVLEELDGDDSFPQLDQTEVMSRSARYDPIPVTPMSSPSPVSCPPTAGTRRKLERTSSLSESSRKKRCMSPPELSFEDPNPSRFRDYQSDQWTKKFEELCSFVKENGTCQVPHGYANNPSLSRWTKRQRYQYKLKVEGKPSTMTDDRIKALNALGFVVSDYICLLFLTTSS